MPMLRSDLCDSSDAYIVAKGIIAVKGGNNRDTKNMSFALTDDAPFTHWIPKIKIKHELIDNAENLDVVMPMYNLIECSKNYRKTTGSSLNYHRDEAKDPPADNYNPDPITNSPSFKYESSIAEKITINNKDYKNDNRKKKMLKLLCH